MQTGTSKIAPLSEWSAYRPIQASPSVSQPSLSSRFFFLYTLILLPLFDKLMTFPLRCHSSPAKPLRNLYPLLSISHEKSCR